MDLQSIFYIVGIIAMTLFALLIGVIIYMVFFIKKVVTNAEREVVGRIMEFTKPVDVLKGMATSALGNLFLKFRGNAGRN